MATAVAIRKFVDVKRPPQRLMPGNRPFPVEPPPFRSAPSFQTKARLARVTRLFRFRPLRVSNTTASAATQDHQGPV